MLHAISWKEYFTLMGLGFLVFNGWWVVRYYPGLRLGGGDKVGQGRQILPEAPTVVKREEAEKPVVAAAGEVIGKPDQAGTAGGSQSMIFPTAGTSETGVAGGSPKEEGKAEIATAGRLEQLPVPAAIPKPVFLSELAGDLRNEVQALVLKAIETRMVEGELVFAFHHCNEAGIRRFGFISWMSSSRESSLLEKQEGAFLTSFLYAGQWSQCGRSSCCSSCWSVR